MSNITEEKKKEISDQCHALGFKNTKQGAVEIIVSEIKRADKHEIRILLEVYESFIKDDLAKEVEEHLSKTNKIFK